MFSIKIHNILLLLLTLTITGCASVTYEEPTSGPIARVRFVTDMEMVTVVRGYKSKECDDEHEMMRLRNGFVFNSDPRCLGIPLWDYHENGAKEFYIRAGVPQVYMFEGAKGNRIICKCGVVIQHTFEEGKDYEVSYKWNNCNCNVEVYEIRKNIVGNAEKILLQNRDRNLPSDFSKTCLAKFKEVLLY